MSDAPDTIWTGPSIDDKGEYWDVGHFDVYGEGTPYRRADLPLTPEALASLSTAQIMADPRVRALVEALGEIAKEEFYPMGIGVKPQLTHAAKIAIEALAALEPKP